MTNLNMSLQLVVESAKRINIEVHHKIVLERLFSAFDQLTSGENGGDGIFLASNQREN